MCKYVLFVCHTLPDLTYKHNIFFMPVRWTVCVFPGEGRPGCARHTAGRGFLAALASGDPGRRHLWPRVPPSQGPSGAPGWAGRAHHWGRDWYAQPATDCWSAAADCWRAGPLPPTPAHGTEGMAGRPGNRRDTQRFHGGSDRRRPLV